MANVSQIKLPNGNTYDINAKTVTGKTVGTNVPSNAVFTDTNNAVTQTETSTNANYEVLLSGTDGTATTTGGVGKSADLLFNPNSCLLTVKGGILATRDNEARISVKCSDTQVKAYLFSNADGDIGIWGLDSQDADISVIMKKSNGELRIYGDTYSISNPSKFRSAIGLGKTYSFTSSAAQNISNNTETAAGSLTITEAGTYIFIACAAWASNSNGYREIRIANNSSTSALDRFALSTVSATSGTNTIQQVITYISVSANSVYRVVVKQNSGTTLSLANCGLKAIRIG